MNDWTLIRDGHEWNKYRETCFRESVRKARHNVVNGRMSGEPASYPFMVYSDVRPNNDTPDDINHYLIYVDEVGPLMDFYISDIVEKEVLDGD